MNLKLKAKIIEKFGKMIDFSKKVGMTEQAVSRIVTGRQALPGSEKEKWAKFLECKIDEIF